MMPSFELLQPARLADALSLLDRRGNEIWKMAGGNDSLDWFKDRVKRPKAVMDLGALTELKGIRETADGIEIGALTTLAEISTNPLIRNKYKVLADAAGRVASPQIRNASSLGGNVSQDARCWYYRSGLNCYRAGGNTCFADTPAGQNREHAIFDASRCIAVSPSDTAPALVVLEAKMVIKTAKAERVIDAEKFFIGPAVDITHMTVIKPNELLTAIRIPAKWAGAKFYFEKVADRTPGLCAGQCRLGAQGQQRHHRGGARRLRWGVVHAAFHQSGGRSGEGRQAGRRNQLARGQDRRAWRSAGQFQSVQGSPDGEPGQTRHPGCGLKNREPDGIVANET
jgi:xanthine dehydrogenase YagS FAD-binding subunit